MFLKYNNNNNSNNHVCQSVLDTRVCCAKTAELIEMPFDG